MTAGDDQLINSISLLQERKFKYRHYITQDVFELILTATGIFLPNQFLAK